MGCYLNMIRFSSLSCLAFGLAKCFRIHNYIYFLGCQMFFGLVQSSGWPASVACMGNWFGFGHRGLIMGIWSSNPAVGHVLGSVIAGSFVDKDWSFSFFAVAAICSALNLVIFFLLVPKPEMVKCLEPHHCTDVQETQKENDSLVAFDNVEEAKEDDYLIVSSFLFDISFSMVFDTKNRSVEQMLAFLIFSILGNQAHHVFSHFPRKFQQTNNLFRNTYLPSGVVTSDQLLTSITMPSAKYSYIFPSTLESLDKILFLLA